MILERRKRLRRSAFRQCDVSSMMTRLMNPLLVSLLLLSSSSSVSALLPIRTTRTRTATLRPSTERSYEHPALQPRHAQIGNQRWNTPHRHGHLQLQKCNEVPIHGYLSKDSYVYRRTRSILSSTSSSSSSSSSSSTKRNATNKAPSSANSKQAKSKKENNYKKKSKNDISIDTGKNSNNNGAQQKTAPVNESDDNEDVQMKDETSQSSSSDDSGTFDDAHVRFEMKMNEMIHKDQADGNLTREFRS